MNTDNNLENNIGSESLGGIQSPINNEPVNNVGDNNFIPFQDLNNSPLNVPTENLDSVGVQNPAPENNYFNQGVNSAPINNDAAIVAFNTDQHFNVSDVDTNSGYDPKFVMNGLKNLISLASMIPFDCIILV